MLHSSFAVSTRRNRKSIRTFPLFWKTFNSSICKSHWTLLWRGKRSLKGVAIVSAQVDALEVWRNGEIGQFFLQQTGLGHYKALYWLHRQPFFLLKKGKRSLYRKEKTNCAYVTNSKIKFDGKNTLKARNYLLKTASVETTLRDQQRCLVVKRLSLNSIGDWNLYLHCVRGTDILTLLAEQGKLTKVSVGFSMLGKIKFIILK